MNVEAIMSKPIHGCHRDQTAQSALRWMRDHDIGCVPVVDDGMSMMRVHLLTLTLCGLTATLGACDGDRANPPDAREFAEVRSDKPHEQDPELDATEAELLAAQNRALSFELYHALRDGEAAGRGFAISGYSLRSAFGMLLPGTVEPARAELATALHFSLVEKRQHTAHNWLAAELAKRNLAASDQAAAVELHSANGVWVLEKYADHIASDYLDVLAVHYDAGVHLARFDTRPEAERVALNAWVAERTGDLIPALFPADSISKDSALVLVNALYLKAPWAEAFNPERTAPAPFVRLDGSETQVAMMHAEDLPAMYGEDPDYQAVAIPLRGQALELLVIVPNDFPTFETKLDPSALSSLRDAMLPAIVTTSLPKFEIAAAFELGDEFNALGMVAPFVDDHSFDAILERLGVITTVAHQAVIEVDEVGIEAAAATGIVITVTSALIPDAEIVVDRPFIFAIRDAPPDTLLFLGRVLDPG